MLQSKEDNNGDNNIMNNNQISRRSFLRSAAMGTGAVLIYSIAGNTLFAKSADNVSFSTDKAKGGCSKCEDEIAAMLKDKAKVAKLESLFPPKSKICFYVRRHKKRKFPEGIHIAVGNCAHALKEDADLFIPGCGKTITSDSIFSSIVKRFDKAGSVK